VLFQNCVDIHPAIKIICFLVFSIFLSLGGKAAFGTALFLFTTTILFSGLSLLRGSISILMRMKWFFISIFIVYLSFTPGSPLWVSSFWSPTIEGISQGGYRVGILLLVILAAKMLMNSVSQDSLISALYWLLAPLKYVGELRSVFIVRLVLTIESVEKVQSILVKEKEHVSSMDVNAMEKWREYFSSVFHSLITRRQCVDQMREFPLLAPPSLWQWCVPIALVGLFILVI